MSGYQRQSLPNIQPDLPINAEDLNLEFDALAAAFNATGGHTHNGAPGEGAKISLTSSVTGIMPLANGGTGSSTASGARAALGFSAGAESGTVSSVALAVPTGFSVSNSPITTSGTITIGYASGYKGYTTAEANKLAGIASGAQVNTVTSVAGKTGAVTLAKGDVDLGNVDNTSDANKPVSTATQTALNAKVSLSGTESVTGIKWFVGGGGLRVRGSSAYLGFYNEGDSRVGYVGNGSTSNNDIYLHADQSGADIRLNPGAGGSVGVGGNFTVTGIINAGTSLSGQNLQIRHASTTRNTDTVFYSGTSNDVFKNTAAGFKTSLNITTADISDLATNLNRKVSKTGDIMTGQLDFASFNQQTDAKIRVRGAKNGIEFGNENQNGYGSVLGANASNGRPFLIFSGEAGSTTNNSVRTRGLRASIFKGDLSGGFVWETVANANADNQIPTTLMSLSGAGNFSTTGYIQSDTYVVAPTLAMTSTQTTYPNHTTFITADGSDFRKNTKTGLLRSLKLDEFSVTVESFGAVGNGTTNDAAAFQAAVNALPTTGGRIIVNGGPVYRLDTAPNEGTKSVYWDIGSHVSFTGTANAFYGFPYTVTNFGHYAVGPLIRARGKTGNAIATKGGCSAFTVDVIQPNTDPAPICAYYGGASSASTVSTASIWGANFLVGAQSGFRGIAQGIEVDVNVHTGAHADAITKGISLSGAGGVDASVAIEITRMSEKWKRGLHIMDARDGIIVEHDDNGRGIFIRPAHDATASGFNNAGISVKQNTNTADAIILQRFTNSTPNGYFIRAVNATNTQTLYSIDTNGNQAIYGYNIANNHRATNPTVAPGAGQTSFGSSFVDGSYTPPSSANGYIIMGVGTKLVRVPYYNN